MSAIVADAIPDYSIPDEIAHTQVTPSGLVRHQEEKRVFFVVHGSLVGLATANNYAPVHPDESTTANTTGQIDYIPAKTTAEAVLEIRRLSGLTWDELGEIFDVSRRSVHHWANGRRISAGNERVVHQMLATINHLDTGDQARTRARLLGVGILGQSPFKMLASHKFEQVMTLTPGEAKPMRHYLPLAPQALEAQRPPAPSSLLSGNPERFRSSTSKARIARSVRTTKKKK